MSVDVNNRDELEAWLRQQRREVVVEIAARSAMRVLPSLSIVFRVRRKQSVISEDDFNFILLYFRFVHAASVINTFPSNSAFALNLIDLPSSSSFSLISTLVRDYEYLVSAVKMCVDGDVAYGALDTADVSAKINGDIAYKTTNSLNRNDTASRAFTRTENEFNADISMLDDGVFSLDFFVRIGLWRTRKELVWTQRAWLDLKKHLLERNPNWHIWTDWYEARLYPDKFPAPNKKLELARAMILNEIWDQGWEVVNPHIEKLIEEHRPKENQRHVFISYNSNDETKAKWIGSFVEDAGHKVFAQYKDMPPGSNFVQEMQNGLQKMGKMIPVLSPSYEKSEQCQAEWQVAYNLDPSGRDRLIIPVMVEKTVVSPLANQVVQIRAYKQSEELTIKAVLASLSDTTKISGNLRKAISDVASPSPTLSPEGILDVGSNRILDKPDVEDSLFDLADTQLTLISVLEAILPNNVPDAVVVGLQKYGNELRAKGVQPSTGTLEAMQAIVKASMNAPAGSNMWIDEGVQEAFRQFSKKHADIMKHYPLKSVRNDVYEQAKVDEIAATGEALIKPLDELLGIVKQANEAGLTTDEFLQVVKDREQIMRLVASAPVEVVDESKVSAKKRCILQDSGFVDKAIERAEKVAKISDTDAGKAMVGGLKKVAASLWKFIG